MEYQALYRVWRPQKFDDVVGQEQTVRALKNAIKDNKTTHAYLFAGPRGTGKTSIAKIFAKAVNCSAQLDGEPCDQCSACLDIKTGNFMDVVEIDAASNRGIDEIRDLREKVRILPAQGKKKVYIIDEVHMLTTEAFNALLKTLEDPPASVIFILATTEIHKIPATILSRCQIYNFRRLNNKEISERLIEVCENSAIEIEEEAIAILANRADGGLRDALSILDQIYSFKGSGISREDVLQILGIIDEGFAAELIAFVIAKDIASIITLLDNALREGKETVQILRGITTYIRDLLIFKLLKEKAKLQMTSLEKQALLKKQVANISEEQLLNALRIMMDTGEKLRFTESQRYLLELALIDIVKLFSGVKTVSRAASKKEEIPSSNINPVKQINNNKEEKIKTEDKDEKKDAREVLWVKLLYAVQEKNRFTHAALKEGRLIGSKGDSIYIGFRKGYKFHKERLEEKKNRTVLEEALEGILGKKVDLILIFLDDDKYNDIIVKKAIEFFGEDIVQIKD